MLDERGSLHLMDFGLAGWTEDQTTRLTQTGAVLGTPAYMAPEQAAGDRTRVGPASDVYSAGVVLYELLTGRLPFDGGHPIALAYQILHTEPPPPSQRRPGLDPDLEAVCLMAMARDPARRYGNGEEMAAALAALAPTAQPPVQPAAKPKGAPTRPSSPGDRKSGGAAPGRRDEAVTRRGASVRGRNTVPPASAMATARPPAAPSAHRGRETVRPSRAGTNWMVWGGALLAVLVGLAVAAAVVVPRLSRHHPQDTPPSAQKPDPPPVHPPVAQPHDQPPPLVEKTTVGRAVGVAQDRLTFTADGLQQTVTVPGGAVVRIDDKAGALNEIQKDDAVVVTFQGDVVTKVEAQNPPPAPPPTPPAEVTVAGAFIRAEKGRLTATVDGKQRTFTLPDAAHVRIDGKEGKLEDVMKDSTLTITARNDVASKVEVQTPAAPPLRPTTEAGKVIRVDKDRLTVSVDGKEKTVSIPATARVVIDFKDGKLTDVHPDCTVIFTAKDDAIVRVETQSLSAPSKAEAPFDADKAKGAAAGVGRVPGRARGARSGPGRWGENEAGAHPARNVSDGSAQGGRGAEWAQLDDAATQGRADQTVLPGRLHGDAGGIRPGYGREEPQFFLQRRQRRFQAECEPGHVTVPGGRADPE